MLYLFIYLIFIYLKFCFKNKELYHEFYIYYISTNANVTKLHIRNKLIFLKTNLFFISAAIIECALLSENINNVENVRNNVHILKLIELSGEETNHIFNMALRLFTLYH